MTVLVKTMNINLETNNAHTVAAYSNSEIIINSKSYTTSLIISPDEIINPWPVTHIQQLNETNVQPLLKYQPKIILVGHNQLNSFAHPSLTSALSSHSIALESMSIGAACRTFNVLLSEGRAVVLGIIL